MIVGMNEAPIQTERERLENGGISLLKYLMDDLIETSNTICKRVRFISHMKSLDLFGWSVHGRIGVEFWVRIIVLWSHKFPENPGN